LDVAALIQRHDGVLLFGSTKFLLWGDIVVMLSARRTSEIVDDITLGRIGTSCMDGVAFAEEVWGQF
jgi:hypothetical protein